ncbi:AMP-binding protein [Rhizobium oryziradicis]|uniref:AMP-binding protein n=1 Tax=Rhizobium oryziradicis TaxID=1867956 RepID=UPI001FDA5E1D|nr:AMP-binding protein [Rhizobium oryziradicis]
MNSIAARLRGVGTSVGMESEDPVRFRAKVGPKRPAILEIKTGQSLNYCELDLLVGRVASMLAEATLGDDPSPRIAFVGRNSIAQLAVCFACQRIGAIFVPINWRLNLVEISMILDDCQPALVIFEDEFQAQIKVGSSTMLLSVDGEDGLNRRCQSYTPFAPDFGSAERTCVLLYTSGTTGVPKGVMLSARNLYYSALNFSFLCDVSTDSVVLCELPFFHTIGLVALARTALLMGGRLVISDRFLPERTFGIMADPAIGVTHYCGVPQIASALRANQHWDPSALRRLKAIFMGGAPLPPVLIERFMDDGIALVNGYGMSEAGTTCHMPLDSEQIMRHPGSIGYPAPLIDLRIVDADGQDVAEGEVGEILLRGPTVTSGYWNKPDLTEAAFWDGWYRSGDLARSQDGVIYLADRLKDMYISGGENVYPAEVEAALVEHPGIAEVAIIGVAHPEWGEVGIALIVASDKSLQEEEVHAHCVARLSSFKRPKKVVFVDSLPRTASGKVLKHVLRKNYDHSSI